MSEIKKVVLFGSPCGFVSQVMDHLIREGYSIAAQVEPGIPDAGHTVRTFTTRRRIRSSSRLPMTSSVGVQASGRTTVQRIQISDHHSEDVVRTLSGLGADLAVVCCYPRRLPLQLVQTARLGGVNVHPSLLPAYRGPTPLFWVYRNGETRSGVTVHEVDRSLDTGPILRQTALEVPVGSSGKQVWADAATAGAELLVECIDTILRGESMPVPQDETRASYYTRPTDSDVLIDPIKWDAWHVYHFCKGVLPMGYKPMVRQGASVRQVNNVHRYVDDLADRERPLPGHEWLTCLTGAVQIHLGPALF